MKRCLAMLLCVLLLTSSVPLVSANNYNDDHMNWGEYACPHTHTEEVAEIPSTCIEQGRAAYTRCTDCKLIIAGSKEALPLADHTYTTREVFPDCENSGYVIHTCTVCGDSYVDGRVDALGHAYALTENVAPTCVATGKKVYVCATCGDEYTEVIAATGRHDYDHDCDEKCNVCGYERDDAHEYLYHAGAEPTCGEPGYDIYKCWGLFCSNPYVYVEIPATGNHTYSSECDVVCNVCKQERETTASHNFTLTNSADVTCVTDGFRTYTCSACGDCYTDVEKATGHKYHIVVTAPDCENGGYTTHTCSVCGDCVVDNHVDALGHSYAVTKDEAPTCTADGVKIYTCSRCGDSYSENIAALNHTYTTREVFPDCENSGYVIHTCTVCGDSYVDGRVDALGHAYELTENVAPTCVATGKKVYVCATCGDEYTEVIAATGRHTYEHECDETCNVCGYVRKNAHEYIYHGGSEPTCGEPGYDVYKCWGMFCSNPYLYVEIPATGNHTYSGNCDVVCNVCKQERETTASHNYTLTDSVDVTCVTDGSRTYTCSGCGDCYTDVEKATGHKYHVVVTAPDCENGGYTTHICSVCGDCVVDNHVDALGHTAVVVKGYAPTCEAEGLTDGEKCSACGEVLTAQQVIPMSAHVYDDDRDADCNVCGEKREVEIRTPGDANGDGKVNNRDLGLLQQHLNEYDVVIDLSAVDVNGDGKINNRDLGLLQQYLNDWDVILK